MARANVVDHKAFFPILAQASGDGRGQEFKADACVETAAPIVVALVKSLAKLGGFKSSELLAALGSTAAKPAAKAATVKRATKPAAAAEPAKRTRRAAAEVPAKAERSARAKPAKFAKDDAVMAHCADRDKPMKAKVVGLRAAGTKVRVHFLTDDYVANVDAKLVKAR